MQLLYKQTKGVLPECAAQLEAALDDAEKKTKAAHEALKAFDEAEIRGGYHG